MTCHNFVTSTFTVQCLNVDLIRFNIQGRGASTGSDDMHYCCTTVRNMNTEEAFDLFFQKMDLLQQETGAQEPSLPRKRKTPRRFETACPGYHSNSVEQHYGQVYFEVLDSAVSSITNHFDQPGYSIPVTFHLY